MDFFSRQKPLRGQFALSRQLREEFFEHKLVDFSNDSLHISLTGITELDILFVNYLMKAVARWKVLSKLRKNSLPILVVRLSLNGGLNQMILRVFKKFITAHFLKQRRFKY